MANLLLIESPGKVKKLTQILGAGWIVKASMGHIRELTHDGEDALGFELDGNQIHCHYAPRDARAQKVIASLQQAVRQADAVYIATDPDREGETIGWHLQQALRLKQPQRVIYSEITAAAVRRAIANPQKLDENLIAAGRARDCLDKLVGYKGSRHVVWPLNNGAKSMGRVQSATLHLLCLREREIQAFTPEAYWSVWVTYQEGFKAFYRRRSTSERPAIPAGTTDGISPETDDTLPDELSQADSPVGGKAPKKAAASAPESDRVTTQAEAERLVAIARSSPHQVLKVTGKVHSQSPPPPFITSTLQQAAGAKLQFSPDKTMKIAQSLYEAGHITYMRTDSVFLSEPFRAAVRSHLQQHDPTNVPPQPTQHRSAKTAQAAHEAIRPTEVSRMPAQLQAQLAADAAQLYDLIWQRAVASQCCPARLRKTQIVTQSGEAFWEARGQVIEFAGYSRYWSNLSADSQLPAVTPGQTLQLQQAQADAKQTQPPPRYTEPKLVQLMERQGIGRPSTYAPTIKVLKERTYIALVKGKLQPTALGLTLDAALDTLLPDLIQPAFTAQMEERLDAIATGQQDWQTYLTGWYREYFIPALAQAKRQLSNHATLSLNAGGTTLPIPPAQSSEKSSEKPPAKSTTKSPAKSPARSSVKSTIKSQANAAPSEQRAQRTTRKKSLPHCPQCQQSMLKVASHSPKLKAKHFLKCEAPGCGTVMFWNPQKKTYELPYAQRVPDANTLTDYPCPNCGALLERYSYQKEGKDKIMLRCALVENRRGKCREVAFFQSREGFWSPKFGNLATEK